MKTKEIVINACFGGFGLSDLAYEKLAEYGIPIIKYIEEKRGKDGKYLKEPKNEGKVIFDKELSDDKEIMAFGRYWDTWINGNREHPLLIKVIKELGGKADGQCAELKIIKIPSEIEYEIKEYDGLEHVAEVHRTWD